MIWKPVTLINRTETGKDALGNPVYEESPGSQFPVRFTPWDAQDIALEGREVTVNQRKLLVRIPRTEFPDCQKVQFEGEVYEVMQVTDVSPRFTLLYVKKYGR